MILLDRDKLFYDNIKLVYMSLKDFKGNKDDLIQSGFMGLLNAIDNFDSKKGYKFSSFAVKHIKCSMKQEIKKSYPIKINPKIFEIIDYMNGKAIKVNEVASLFKVSKKVVLDALSYKGMTIFDESLFFKEDEFSKYLLCLNDDEKRIIILKFKHNLYAYDIARLLKVSRGTITKKLKSALIKISESI